MWNKLTTRFAVAFVGITLIILASTSLSINYLIKQSFTNYLYERKELKMEEIINESKNIFKSSGSWTISAVMFLAHQAMMEDMDIMMVDQNGNEVWSSFGMGMGANMSMEQFQDKFPNMLVVKKEVVVDDKKVGEIYFSFDTRQSGWSILDQNFIRSFNQSMLILVVLFSIVALALSFFLSRKLSAPLLEIKKGANHLRFGHLNERVHIKEKTGEIKELADAFNHLADTLQRQEQLRKNLMADVAHELRTPLATLRSHLEAFQDGIWEPTKERLNSSQQQVMRLIRLVGDIEKLNQAENPLVQLHIQPIHLNELINQVVQTLESEWSHKPMNVNVIIDDQITLMGDGDRITQVLLNLLSNAYKFTPENGNITILAKESNSEVTILVKDNGSGISKEDLPHIFERFFRGEKSRNRSYGGAGIGLAIVKAIVEAHKGTISVESEVGEGTTFTIVFPKKIH
ncbi:ATP-binding protein [Microaerobacter geothermalis]|uniref:sensor histidine kinase n=1 Tax=Microaerobacter geothermalis TaxID=674972 RepID=UPI001F19B42B|nr:ATP-binding protein [Microaerobacter geothermalis]MCF6092634.1 ATP-binding protein [Microaerobacter geothermalis]